ncbi:MAG: PAS domain-containing sensor histidine kinase [Alphaproteobacteria bacterium]
MTKTNGSGSKVSRPTGDSLTTRLRFVWTSDQSGAIRLLTEDQRLEALKANLERGAWPATSKARFAFDAHATFVNEPLALEAADGPLTVTISGTPVKGAQGSFEGFRGFGTIALPAAKPKSEPAPKVRSRPADAEAAPGLSEIERQAFRDIARALGERPSRSPHAENRDIPVIETRAATAPVPSPVVTESPSAAEPLLATLFDRLPVGVLLSRGAVPILMNETLLNWLDYDSVDTFHDSGGIESMFGGRHPARRSPHDDSAMLIRRRDGDTIALAVHLQTIAWGDLPASLMLFERPRDRDEELFETETAEDTSERVSSDDLSAILETASDGVAVLDHDGRILMLNRSAEALFGYDTDDVEGERFVALLNEESRDRIVSYIETLGGPGVQSLLNDGREIIAETRQGGKIPLFVTIGQLGEAAQSKYCVFMRDMTNVKRAERDLTEARRAAEIASARKSDFLARISHEIRTPLSAIIGFAEIMQEERFGPLGNKRYKDYLKDILTSGAFVIDLVNDLLDLSKIEAGRAELDFQEVDVNGVLVDASSLLQEEARRARVILRMSLESHLPSLMADKRALHQIILNLMSNAIKFTPEGGQVIVSTTHAAEGDVIIRVKDTGIGMTDQELITALEPFRQLSTTRQSGGTGLGLPLTKALVEANRAAFSIKSARNAGTLVEITFPPTRVLTS